MMYTHADVFLFMCEAETVLIGLEDIAKNDKVSEFM
jgi:hypothetical protein